MKVADSVLLKINPNEIEMITVLKTGPAVERLGKAAANGVLFIKTKHFAREKSWQFLCGKSADYLRAVPVADSLETVAYIINGEVIEKNPALQLVGLTDADMKDLQIISGDTLKKKYSIAGRKYGVVIQRLTAKP